MLSEKKVFLYFYAVKKYVFVIISLTGNYKCIDTQKHLRVYGTHTIPPFLLI